MSQDPRYLGDGVYATFDGYHVVLTAAGDGHTNLIYLESDVMSELFRFLETIHGVKIKIEKAGGGE